MTLKNLLQSSLFLFVLLLTGCVSKVKLEVAQPAKINTSGIQKVVVTQFQVKGIRYRQLVERNGNWTVKEIRLSQSQNQAIARLVRGKIVNFISKSPSFEIVYSDKLSQLDNRKAIQQTVAAGGFRSEQVDAIIEGDIWIDVSNFDGSELDKVSLKYIRRGQGKNDPAYTVNAVAFFPYKSMNGSLGVSLRMIRFEPTELLAVSTDIRSFRHKIGGKPKGLIEQVSDGANQAQSLAVSTNQDQADDEIEIEESDNALPSFEQVIADMAESVSAQFMKDIAISTKTLNITLASGDSQVLELMKAGAYEKAIERLNALEQRDANDQYNLGLCYEALGEYGLASVAYDEALNLEPTNLTFAKGVGRIERLKRDYRQVRDQLNAQN